MPSQVISSVENNFTKGLITESTGLNFPENAATDTENCVYEITGDVTRRLGISQEVNTPPYSIAYLNVAQSSYVWNNVGGDSTVKWIVRQHGKTLSFYSVDSATTTNGIAGQLVGQRDISNLSVLLGVFDATAECTFADGNGYLFIFHPSCNPMYIYATKASGIILLNSIVLQTRDFAGLTFGEPNNDVRPVGLSPEHSYNLQNQGWSTGPTWIADSSTPWPLSVTTVAFTTYSGLVGVTPGNEVQIRSMDLPSYPYYIPQGSAVASGTVVSYSGTTLTISVSAIHTSWQGQLIQNTQIVPGDIGKMNTFKSSSGVYPSNSDVWWYFKDNTGAFNPSTTLANVTYGLGQAPQGHFILNPFNQDRSSISAVAGLTTIQTNKRPTNGAWFAGRIWYTGVSDSFAPTGDATAYTWTENIYFSQVVDTIADFNKCYQSNDPSSENLNSLLPTDGGEIRIPGCGVIYKLWPTQNGMLVFGANGVWFITGSQGIGFTANDYTITKISSVQSISSTSFVNVLGLPYFWNEEGIYSVITQQNGSIAVEPITVGTILSYYNNIPFASKKYVRGDYNPIDYIIQWSFRSTQETDITSRYQMDTIMTFNTYNKAFYPYTLGTDSFGTYINDVKYISFPTISASTPDAALYYPSSMPVSAGASTAYIIFALEQDTRYIDWNSVDYSSYFITGYKIHGQGQKRFQVPYIYVYSRGPDYTSYMIQGIWDYAADRNSNRWSVPQIAINPEGHFNMKFRRHRIRGNGIVLQFKVSSVSGKAFDIMGWSVYENLNQGV